MKFITALVALAQAVPIVDSWIEKLLTAWATYKVEKIKGPIIELQKQRAILMRDISRATSDEERLTYSIILHKLNHGQLSQPDS